MSQLQVADGCRSRYWLANSQRFDMHDTAESAVTARKKQKDLLALIEHSLSRGVFIRYGEAYEFVRGLDEMHAEIRTLVRNERAAEAVPLYEAFIAATYDKIEEIDDSGGNLGMFFADLFCGWISARERAGLDAEGTLAQANKWIENDTYGFCHDIELKMFEALGKEGRKLFSEQIRERLDKAWATERATAKRFADHSWPVRRDIDILKGVYRKRKNLASYQGLCEQLGYTRQDCLCIAEIHRARKRHAEALEWVDRGLATRDKRGLGSDYELRELKRSLLVKLGRGGDALEDAWSDFEKQPCEFTYDSVMKLAPKKDRTHWHRRAIDVATKKADLSELMDLCLETNEWDALIGRLNTARNEALEAISHYHTEPVAKCLEKRDAALAARLYRALACRILDAKKSKYYDIALSHLSRTRELYQSTGKTADWKRLVTQLREKHRRKSSFIGDFEALVADEDPTRASKSFGESAGDRWRSMTE